MARYKAGQSGNPSGRPNGSKNRSTKLLEAIGDDIIKLLHVTRDKAIEGDMTAMRLLLERAVPIRKAGYSAIAIPGLEKAKTLTEKAEAVLQSISRGELSPDVGNQLIASITHTAKAIEIDELSRRIEVLELSRGNSENEF